MIFLLFTLRPTLALTYRHLALNAKLGSHGHEIDICCCRKNRHNAYGLRSADIGSQQLLRASRPGAAELDAHGSGSPDDGVRPARAPLGLEESLVRWLAWQRLSPVGLSVGLL